MNINLQEELRALIGAPPVGYEFLEYLFLGFLVLFLCFSAVSVVASFFGFFKR